MNDVYHSKLITTVNNMNNKWMSDLNTVSFGVAAVYKFFPFYSVFSWFSFTRYPSQLSVFLSLLLPSTYILKSSFPHSVFSSLRDYFSVFPFPVSQPLSKLLVIHQGVYHVQYIACCFVYNCIVFCIHSIHKEYRDKKKTPVLWLDNIISRH